MAKREFSETSTAYEVLEGVNLQGKRVLVTGVSAGLGIETARALVQRGAQVVGTARDTSKGRDAAETILSAAADGGSLEIMALDLASLASVRACADELLKRNDPFDLVIANAGVMACPKGLTHDGFETHFGTNHLGHFVLINRIAPLLRAGARVITLSSWGHNFADVDLDDPNFERRDYSEYGAYGQSKTANALFAVEFDRRHKSAGVRATAVHPGGIATELYRHIAPETLKELSGEADPDAGERPALWKTAAQGAATTVWAGVVADADAIGGRYCEDCHVAEPSEDGSVGGQMGGIRDYASNPQRAAALWQKSEEMVGERF